MIKEVVYTVDYETKEQIKKARELKERLHNKYKCVCIYPNGLYQARVIATNSYK